MPFGPLRLSNTIATRSFGLEGELKGWCTTMHPKATSSYQGLRQTTEMAVYVEGDAPHYGN